ncbi:NUDIX hydrolase [Methanoculleus sp. FWC-SCC1]|uniref:NUDIX hydrolase n=1 Tax=Methanoculleus frigidifontis TaxID=2584085 RepID=A0ABT8MAQ7_9EURY|nr:NUDIX hydrolase [Methanoculleus sp. FWC-SCC1]MDN7025013.1 NUDIX hydrolase [Methanoculleus sp. FWC-SCC1]
MLVTEIYRGKRLIVEKKTVTLPDGSTRERVVIHPGGAVAMLPIEGDDCYLIRQYRFAIDATIYEVPAGTIDEGEAPDETAHRELVEEIGMKAATLIPKGYIYPSPGYTDETIHLYEARDLAPSDEHQMDEDEVIEVVKVPIAEIRRMIDDGEIVDAKTICLVCRCLR